MWCSNRVPVVRWRTLNPLKHCPISGGEGMLTVFKDIVMLVSYGGYTEKVIKDLLGDRQNET